MTATLKMDGIKARAALKKKYYNEASCEQKEEKSKSYAMLILTLVGLALSFIFGMISYLSAKYYISNSSAPTGVGDAMVAFGILAIASFIVSIIVLISHMGNKDARLARRNPNHYIKSRAEELFRKSGHKRFLERLDDGNVIEIYLERVGLGKYYKLSYTYLVDDKNVEESTFYGFVINPKIKTDITEPVFDYNKLELIVPIDFKAEDRIDVSSNEVGIQAWRKTHPITKW